MSVRARALDPFDVPRVRATALMNNLTVVARNTADFQKSAVRLVNRGDDRSA